MSTLSEPSRHCAETPARVAVEKADELAEG
jgi:hypothetical protein